MHLGKLPCSQRTAELAYQQQFKAVQAVDDAAPRLGGLTLDATTIHTFKQKFTQNLAPAASASRTAASLYLASSRVKDTASNVVVTSTLDAPNVKNEALQLLDAGLQMSDMALEAMIASHMAAGQNEPADDRSCIPSWPQPRSFGNGLRSRIAEMAWSRSSQSLLNLPSGPIFPELLRRSPPSGH